MKQVTICEAERPKLEPMKESFYLQPVILVEELQNDTGEER